MRYWRLGAVLLVLLLLVYGGKGDTQEMSGGGGSGSGVQTDSNCNQAQYFAIGKLCQDTDDGKLYKGTGAAVVEIAAGSSGDVVGPASSTNGHSICFDGTTGKLLKSCGGAYLPMVYPGAGVPVSTGSAWDTSLNITAISDSTSTTSSTTAASATAVKSAYDLANGKQASDADLTSLANGITGVVKGAGNGNGYSAATAQVDYLAPSTAGGITPTVVSGVTRAWTYYNSAGAIVKIEIYPDAAVGDYYADATVNGSLGWAAANLPAYGTLVIHPGTYQVDRPLTFADGVKIFANGATIQRVNQLATTTSTTITSGVTTQITVADATGFRVGQRINILNGSTFDSTANRTISNINGNEITVSSAFQASVSGTTNVYLNFKLAQIGENGEVHNLTINGNRSNWTFARWQVTTEIVVAGSYARVQGCTLSEIPGEAIQFTGAASPAAGKQGVQITNNTILNVGGNGIHLSGCNNTLISGNTIIGANLDVNVGHVNGNIAFSTQIANTTIAGNYISNGEAGVGGFNQTTYDTTIINNVFNGVSGANKRAIEVNTGSGSNTWGMTVVGNRIYEAEIYIAQQVTGQPSPYNIVIQGNYLYGVYARITILRSQYVSVFGNVIENTGTSIAGIAIQRSFYVTCSGNVIKGGSIGIQLYSPAAMTNISVCQNNIYNPYYNGIKDDTPAGSSQIKIADNVVEITSSAAASSVYGIWTAHGTIANGNTVKMAKGVSAIHMAGNNALVTGNEINVTGATYSVRGDTGTTGNRVFDNKVNAVPSDAGTNQFDRNLGGDETLTAASPTLRNWGTTYLDTTSNTINGTLPDGAFIGQQKIVKMSNATNTATITVTNHLDTAADVCTFNSTDDVWILQWMGGKWITVGSNSLSCS